MALRSSWEGFLRLNLISVPVKAYSATVSGRGKIGFHQIHAKCHNRIRYKKVCPVHGEVPNDEIVPGYEYAKDQYVLLDRKELSSLRTNGDKAIDIDVFIRPDALEPLYQGDRTYYLTPDGRVAHKPYAVLHKVMVEEERHAIATMVFSGRDQLVVVRPMDRLLVVTLLNYEETVQKPDTFESEVPDTEVSTKELDLARALVRASTVKAFDFGKYRDEYSAKVTKLIEAKASGKGRITLPKHEEPAVINLMDALRKSLEQAEHGKKAPAGRRKAEHKPAARPRRKTG